MNINSVISQINNAFNSTSSNQVSDQLSEGIKNGLDMLINGGSNQVIAGKVINIDGSNLLLALGENELIQARLDGNSNVNIGEILTFSVKNAESSKITLTPLFENTNQALTVNSALEQAQLPVNAQNQYMVKSMMNEGLSIDKQSLYEMSKAMQANATADVLDLAKMSRLNIPLTEDMVTQFKNYTNFEHQITNALSDISDSFLDSYKIISDLDSPSKAIDFIKNNIDILLDESVENLNDNSLKDIQLNENDQADTTSLNVENKLENNKANINDDLVNKNPLDKPDTALENNNQTITKDIIKALNNMDSISLSEDTKLAIKNGNLQAKDLLKDILAAIKSTDRNDSEDALKKLDNDLKKLFDNSSFKEIFKKQMMEKYLLNPEDVAKEGEVSKLYEKLSSNLKQLSNLTTENNVQDIPFTQNINNLNQNLDFMNQLNQTFNYVQIPLKMNDKEAAGELYVYSNKKSLAQSDGNVSALLHLDMDHLGPMDVHVFLNGNINDVKTKFYLKDDAALDLIAENIDLLNKRLEKRGYSMSSEFINDDIRNSVMDKMLEDNKNISVISSSSFDARA